MWIASNLLNRPVAPTLNRNLVATRKPSQGQATETFTRTGSSEPSKVVRTIKAVASGATVAVVVALANRYSPLLGATLAGGAVGAGGLTLGLLGSIEMLHKRPKDGAGGSAGLMAAGGTILAGAAGVTTGIGLALGVSPEVAAVASGAAVAASHWLISGYKLPGASS